MSGDVGHVFFDFASAKLSDVERWAAIGRVTAADQCMIRSMPGVRVTILVPPFRAPIVRTIGTRQPDSHEVVNLLRATDADQHLILRLIRSEVAMSIDQLCAFIRDRLVFLALEIPRDAVFTWRGSNETIVPIFSHFLPTAPFIGSGSHKLHDVSDFHVTPR